MLESDANHEEKVTSALENDMKNLANFHQSSQKSQIWDFYWVFYPKQKIMSLKFTGELCVTTMKNDVKFEEKFT